MEESLTFIRKQMVVKLFYYNFEFRSMFLYPMEIHGGTNRSEDPYITQYIYSIC